MRNATILFLITCLNVGTIAPALGSRPGTCQQCGNGSNCDCRSCRHSNDVCSCTMEEEEIKKHCWKTKCKQVCIPPIRLPKWFCWFGKRYAKGRVRRVNELEKHEYKCSKRRCQWDVKSTCSCCDCASTDSSEPRPFEVVADIPEPIMKSLEYRPPLKSNVLPASYLTPIDEEPEVVVASEIDSAKMINRWLQSGGSVR